MEAIFPDEQAVAGAFILGWRRRPGSPVSSDNAEQTATVILKRAYVVVPSSADPAAGSLVPAPAAPAIFEGDMPGQILANGDFADGLAGWSTTGGASASLVDEAARIERNGAGDLRATATFSRQLRERGFGLAVMAVADAGLANPVPHIVGSGERPADAADPGVFPAADEKPAALSGYGRFSAAATSSSISVRLPAMAADGDVITYDDVSVTTVEYESDLAPFKPEADIVVVADAPPLPLAVAVNGAVRMSQAALAPRELTGLGWEDKVGTSREAEAGDLLGKTQALPDDFSNRYFNGYRRSRRVGPTVPYLQPLDQIEITRDGGDLYAFTLAGTRPVVRHQWFAGSGQDDPCHWRARELAMTLDTLVIEPDRDSAYAVWRAVWPAVFDPGDGPVPLDRNRRVTVRLEEV